MISAFGAALASLLALTIAAAGGTDGRTCRKLDAQYRANVTVAADALEAYERCVAAAPEKCGFEFSDLGEAQEVLQAAFAYYAKACGSAIADKSAGFGSEPDLSLQAQ